MKKKGFTLYLITPLINVVVKCQKYIHQILRVNTFVIIFEQLNESILDGRLQKTTKYLIGLDPLTGTRMMTRNNYILFLTDYCSNASITSLVIICFETLHSYKQNAPELLL